MSLYAYDIEGYIGDVASLAGWESLRRTLENGVMHDPLRAFLAEGFTMSPELLAQALEAAPEPQNVEDLTTLVNLIALARSADEVLIVSDGWNDAESARQPRVVAEFAFNPNQPRHPKGDKRGGEFKATRPEFLSDPSKDGGWREVDDGFGGKMKVRAESGLFDFASQVAQYPKKGPEGLSYFKGKMGGKKYVDALLMREKGQIVGILNHYPMDFPPYERKGNITVMVDPAHRRKGIGSTLMRESIKRWKVDLKKQEFTPSGAALANAFVRKPGKYVEVQELEATELTEHFHYDAERPVDKPKLSNFSVRREADGSITVTRNAWDESKHPRHPKGSGDDGGEFRSKELLPVETDERFAQGFEEAFACDESKCIPIGDSDGSSRVGIRYEEVELLRGKILTHNHPSGGAFSAGDLGSAAQLNLKELRAYGVDADGNKWLHRMLPGSHGWPLSGFELSEGLAQTQDKLRSIYKDRVSNGSMRDQEAFIEWAHRSSEQVAKDYDLRYERRLIGKAKNKPAGVRDRVSMFKQFAIVLDGPGDDILDVWRNGRRPAQHNFFDKSGIVTALDSLESQAKADLSSVLSDQRDALLAAVKKPLEAGTLTAKWITDLKLRKRSDLQLAMQESLRRAFERGQRDIRAEVAGARELAFNPNQKRHPKGAEAGKGGEFAKDVELYHGTADDMIEAIQKEGLKPRGAKGSSEWILDRGGLDMFLADTSGDRKLSVYLTNKEREAELFAFHAAEVRNGYPVIFRVKIPKSEAGKHLVPDERFAEDGKGCIGDLCGYRFQGRIKPEWISVHKRIHERREHALMDGDLELFIVAFASQPSEQRDFASNVFTPREALKWLNARAVEVAGVMDDKLLSDAKSTLLNHMKTGAALSDTMERLFEIFEPFLGDQVDPEVVTPWRLENIVRTNTTEAYNHGRLAELVDPDVLPFVRGVRYQAIMDERTTDVCQYLDGKVFPPNSEALRSLLPPNHFQCRSVVTPIVTGMTVGDFITDAEIEEAKSLADSKFLAETGESRFDFNPNQPRHEAGTPEGGQWKDSEETVITDDVKVAARALADGKKVELLQEIEIATLMHELAEICIECIDKGEKAPTFDLCKVSVKGTNLFCAESKGIPRIQMPQLGGFPIPGSKADKLPRDPIYGGVDLTEPFKEHIRSMGVQIVEYRERVDLLRATQNELNGIKVSRIEKSMEAGKVPEVPIFVSRENYIIDGHHRWAADVGYSAIRGQLHNLTIPVIKIDLPIIHVLNEANKFAKDWGMPQADVKKLSKECDQCQK